MSVDEDTRLACQTCAGGVIEIEILNDNSGKSSHVFHTHLPRNK